MCPWKQLSQGEADDRRVEEVLTFDDPAGNTPEVFHGAVLDHSPVVTPFGARFVTGDQGIGHVVLPALDANGLFEFYTDTLGFPVPRVFRCRRRSSAPSVIRSWASTNATTARLSPRR